MDDGAKTEVALIERRLRRFNPATREAEIVQQRAISSLGGPIVILGDPGLGKSVLTQTLGRQVNSRYVRAGTFVRSKTPAAFSPEPGGHLVIDGLDEVASTTAGGGIDAVLQQLSAIGNPSFILSSRAADWRGASARVRIEDDYGDAVSVLHLEPSIATTPTLFCTPSFRACTQGPSWITLQREDSRISTATRSRYG